MRKIWIEWQPAVEYVGAVRSVFDTNTPKIGPTSHHDIVTRMRQHYGIYMFLEQKGIDKLRDSNISSWRRQSDLKQFAKRNLIYIGIVKSEARDFIMRMKDHEAKWLYQYGPGELYVKFGLVSYWEDEPDPDRLIEHAESVLVLEFQPYENSSKTNSYTMREDEHHIKIYNEGSRSPLPKTIDSRAHFEVA